MNRIELEIKNAKDRADVDSVLVDNGYRVWTEVLVRPGKKTRVTVLCADRAGKEASA